ncbi:MAG: phosphate ABC transporter substrate-binding protein PstS family protein [Candidatus Dadabacteria bacterium]|nr:phosphate ABC transporter substrate-binding protein PstS family protein [Candidatus Dadabacteria bacterium]
MRKTAIIGLVAAILLVAAGYWWWSNQQATGIGLSGTIEIDGSSTVFPITQAMAEEFQNIHPGVKINVGISGTGGGFKRFTKGETDISDASRPISTSEVDAAHTNNINYIEFKIALDGIVVVVNPQNIWVDYLTTAELKAIWETNSTVRSWSDVRAGWPDQPLHLYGPGTDSGTFDYFTEVINGKTKASRADFTASEDDNILVQGVSGDENSLGYFGYAYYVENADKVKIVPIDSGSGPVTPDDSTITNNEYTPLSRPLFIYVNTASLQREGVKAFAEFYMENGEILVQEVGYTPLDALVYENNLSKINSMP